MEFTKQLHIKTSAVACVIDDQDRVLLTRRKVPPFQDQWVMPGGKIDRGESILQALHREVMEEVGIAIRVERLIDVYEHLEVGQLKDHFIILYYLASPASLELRLNQDEVSEALWVHRENLQGLNIPPGTRHILASAFPCLDCRAVGNRKTPEHGH